MAQLTNSDAGSTSSEFIKELDEVIGRHSLLKHPFYQKWNEGTLSREALVNYAKQYYAHVRTFPVYLSACHSNCDEVKVRQLLLENLMDEEHGEENHPELWLRFCDALGIDRDDAKNAELLPKTKESIHILRELTRSDDYRRGVAALYAYESQVPEIARSKREGLKNLYDVTSDRAVSYFAVHEEADVVHREMERDILQDHATDDAAKNDIRDAAETSAKAMWMFLDGVYDAYVAPAAA